MNKVKMLLLNNTAFILFVLLFMFFSILAPRFLAWKSFEIIVVNSCYVGIVAIGMTFVMLTGGIDLSVGSVIYFSAAVLGYVLNDLGWPMWMAVVACLITGLIMGGVNAFLITKIGIVPFIATLITMTTARGFGLFITRSAAVDYPESLTTVDGIMVFGVIPAPAFLFGLMAIVATVFLKRTQTGRQIYAIGNDPEAARKAGLRVGRNISLTYVISGLCASVGAIVSIAQLGRVNASHGIGAEFDAIAAAVMGGASLFGGIGSVLPGTVLGALMIQMIQSGLVFIQVNLYFQPMAMAVTIFLAVLIDSLRTTYLKKMGRRNIMKQTDIEQEGQSLRIGSMK